MGFRSTFITEDVSLEGGIPAWFQEKWGGSINWYTHPETDATELPLSSKFEIKEYGLGRELVPDIQRILREDPAWDDDRFPLELIWFHECGGITKVAIYPDRVLYGEPSGWDMTDGVMHGSCYGCSELTATQDKTTMEGTLASDIKKLEAA